MTGKSVSPAADRAVSELLALRATIERMGEEQDAFILKQNALRYEVARLRGVLQHIESAAKIHCQQYTAGSHGRNAIETFGAMARNALESKS